MAAVNCVRKANPKPVRVHDFAIPELGKAVPYGIYDIAANAGWVNVGISHDTAAFAVAEHPPLVARHRLRRAIPTPSAADHRRLWRQQRRARAPVEASNCKCWPTNLASRSPSAICRLAPASGTK